MTAWRARIEEAEGTLEQRRRHWDHQLQELSGQLLFLEGQLRLEQRDIAEKLDAKDKMIREQQHRIQNLLIQNRRLKELLLKNYKGLSVVKDDDLGEDRSKQHLRIKSIEELKGRSNKERFLDFKDNSLKGFMEETGTTDKDSGLKCKGKLDDSAGHKPSNNAINTQQSEPNDESDESRFSNAGDIGLTNDIDLKVTKDSEVFVNKRKPSDGTMDGLELLENETRKDRQVQGNDYHAEYKPEIKFPNLQGSTHSKVTLVEKLMKMHNMRLQLCSTDDSRANDGEDIVFPNRPADEDVRYYDRTDRDDNAVAYDEENDDDDDVFYDHNDDDEYDEDIETEHSRKEENVLPRNKLVRVVHGANAGSDMARAKEEYVMNQETEGNVCQANEVDFPYPKGNTSSTYPSVTHLTQSHSSNPCDLGKVIVQGDATDQSLSGLHLDIIQSQDKLHEDTVEAKQHSRKSRHANTFFSQGNSELYHIKFRPGLSGVKGQPNEGHAKGHRESDHEKIQPERYELKRKSGKVDAQNAHKDRDDTKTSAVAQTDMHQQNGISTNEKTESQKSHGAKDPAASTLCSGNKSLELKEGTYKQLHFQNTLSNYSASDAPKRSVSHKVPLLHVSRDKKVTGKLSGDSVSRQGAVTKEAAHDGSTTETNLNHENAVNVDQPDDETSPAHSTNDILTHHRKLTSLINKNFSKSSPHLCSTLRTDSVQDKPGQKSSVRPRDVMKRGQARSRSNSAAEMTSGVPSAKERKRGLAKFLTFKF